MSQLVAREQLGAHEQLRVHGRLRADETGPTPGPVVGKAHPGKVRDEGL
jgi:hypothetical protein